MEWLRKPALEPLAVSMCGVKLGQRVLVVGVSDPDLIARLATKAGLTGRACMLDESAQASSAAAVAVEQNGALVETFTAPLTSLPFEAESFDVVVLRNSLAGLDDARRAGVLREAMRIMRPGGRCIAVEDLPRPGFLGLFGGRAGNPQAGQLAVTALSRTGLRGVRLLAEREGIAFVEGVKPALGH